MNPLNLLLSLAIAKNKESEYHVSDSQSLQNTALLSGVIATNPILSYFLIDNKAKELQTVVTAENSVAVAVALPAASQVPTIPIITESDSIDLLKKLDTLKSEIIDTVTLNFDKAISEKIDAKFLKSDDLKIKNFNESTQKYAMKENLDSVKKLKSDFDFISDKENEKYTSKEDKKTIDYLKATYFNDEYFTNYIEILKDEKKFPYVIFQYMIFSGSSYKLSSIRSNIENKIKDSPVTYEAAAEKIVETRTDVPKTSVEKKEPLKK